MADTEFSHVHGRADTYDHNPQAGSSNTLKLLTNFAGAAVSLALVAGVAVWGYKLVVRDVSGIPVVRAAQGDMRVRPADPGGQLAMNTGLAVNEVAAEGEASGPVDRLVLAPQPVDLAPEDQPVAAAVAPVQQPAPLDVVRALEENAAVPIPEVDLSAALAAGNVEDLVNQLTAGVATIDAEAAPATQPVLASVTVPATPRDVASAPVPAVEGPGPTVSYRPQMRPASAPAEVVPARATAPQATADLDAASLPVGTRLVQLGAFDSAEIAREQWDRMQARLGDFLRDKDRVVQQAQSGGRTFYRLRAHGFADLSDARRFCAALVAEGVDCIPVVTR